MKADKKISFSASIRRSVAERFDAHIKRISSNELDRRHKRGYTLEAAIINFLEGADVK